MNGSFFKFLFTALLACLLWAGNAQSEMAGSDIPEKNEYSAVTTGTPEIPVDELQVKLKPLTKESLFVEADAWFELLKTNIHELSSAKLEV